MAATPNASAERKPTSRARAPVHRHGGERDHQLRRDAALMIDGRTSFAHVYPGRARLPAMLPVFSVGAGRVVRRGAGAELAVEIAHGNGWVSRYNGLAFAMAPREQPRCGRRIAAGDLLGYGRRDRAHLRVELWRHDLEPIDLHTEIAGWSVLAWFAETATLSAPASFQHRRATDRTIQSRAERDLDVGPR